MLSEEGFTLWMPALHSILHQVRSPSDDVALDLALKEQHIQQDASLALTDSLVLPKTPGMQLSSGALAWHLHGSGLNPQHQTKAC